MKRSSTVGRQQVSVAGPSRNQLAELAAVIRGLLAQQTGDEDTACRPVILHHSDQGKDTGGASLRLKAVSPADQAEQIRRQVKSAFEKWTAANHRTPSAVYVPGWGQYTVEPQARPNASDQPLQNKVALVTGAAGAIGYGVCRGLLEQGCHVAATDLPGKKLDGFAADLNQLLPGRVLGLGLDVTDADSVSRGFAEVALNWGGIDIVVINAGIALVATLRELELTAFRKLEKVNVEGTLLTLKEAAHYLTLQNTGGDIIVMSTKNVPSPGAGFGAYSATKAACHQLGRIASLELAPYDIRVNMVAPDAVFAEGKYRSGLWDEVGPDRMKARGLDEKGLQEYYRKRNLLKAPVTGRHVANAVLFLVTRQTPTTGATIPVDGGLPDATPR